MRKAWCVEVEWSKSLWAPQSIVEVDDKPFLRVSKMDRQFARIRELKRNRRVLWTDNNFVEYMLQLRNEAVTKSMALSVDPNADVAHASIVSRKRKLLIDDVPGIIEVVFPATDQLAEHHMEMISRANGNSRVEFHITAANIEYLHKAVHVPVSVHPRYTRGSTPFELAPNIKWNEDKHMIHTSFKKNGISRRVSRTLRPLGHDEESWWQMVCMAATEMQATVNAASGGADAVAGVDVPEDAEVSLDGDPVAEHDQE